MSFVHYYTFIRHLKEQHKSVLPCDGKVFSVDDNDTAQQTCSSASNNNDKANLKHYKCKPCKVSFRRKEHYNKHLNSIRHAKNVSLSNSDLTEVVFVSDEAKDLTQVISENELIQMSNCETASTEQEEEDNKSLNSRLDDSIEIIGEVKASKSTFKMLNVDDIKVEKDEDSKSVKDEDATFLLKFFEQTKDDKLTLNKALKRQFKFVSESSSDSEDDKHQKQAQFKQAKIASSESDEDLSLMNCLASFEKSYYDKNNN